MRSLIISMTQYKMSRQRPHAQPTIDHASLNGNRATRFTMADFESTLHTSSILLVISIIIQA